MLSHATARDWLIPYADGMLAADERRRVNGHIVGCASCAAELREVRELNLLLVSLPPAPPSSFAPFWLELQAVLPQRRSLRIPKFFSARRVAVALAMAAVLALALAGTALAAPGAMPDSPLYPVKQLEESVQLATASTSARLSVQMGQAGERLHEAQVMASTHKPLLVANSLRAFKVTLNDAAAALRSADPRTAKQEEDRLRAGLTAVERENTAKEDDDADVRQLVATSVSDLDRIEQSAYGGQTENPGLTIGTEATPDPTATPAPTPSLKPTPRPEPSEDEHHH